MDSGATKHIILHRTTFDTYKLIILRNVYLGDDSVVEAIRMGSITVKAIVRGQIS